MFQKERADIEALKREVFGEKEEKEEESFSSSLQLFTRGFFSSYTKSLTLKGRVDNQAKLIEQLEERLRKNQLLTDTILNHFKLEYHKVTDENGETVVRHELRKQKKAKSRRDYDDED